MSPWQIAALVGLLPFVLVGAHSIGCFLAEAWISYRTGREFERMLEEEHAALIREHEFSEHLIAAEWFIRECMEEADEAGRFPWEVEP